MALKRRDIFTTVRTEGGLLPGDLLQRISAGDGQLEGLKPSDYHLAGSERINEAISRAWNRLLVAWQSFKAASENLAPDDPGTTPTRERWLLILFQELGYGRLLTSKAMEIEGKSYPISHFWQNTPIHLVGRNVTLDKATAGVAGAARSSPHSLLQELLNRSDGHLWGFVSNGLRMRMLRDNVSLTRQAYVEFDLEGMMDGEVYADFALLWLLCHESRVEAERPEQCWLERWSRAAQEQGTRALEQLRDGVEQAIKSLGSGFLAHPANQSLREKLRSGSLDKQDYYRQLLRLVYRLIFLFVAEDRELLLDPNADPVARARYSQYYATTRLRQLAGRRRGTKHADLYRSLQVVMEKLGSDEGCPELALPALGSFLWSSDAISDIEGCDIANHHFLDAIRALTYTEREKLDRIIDYKNIGSEELGSVYESLLELNPELNVHTAEFELKTLAGHERKSTGSYYTPSCLVNCLLDSALDPVLDEACKKKNPEQTILDLKVCDPACGSGHFLVAAAHRMAKRLAAVRTGDEEPSPEATRTALRNIIGRCVYGVDINPMAVELCKVSLWMEAIEPGKPLSFLDHHIQCGNSLLGATPALLRKGIPDEAFKPIEGDDKKYCAEFRAINKDERKGQSQLFSADVQPWERLGDLVTGLANLDEIDDSTIEGIHKKQDHYEEIVKSTSYEFSRLWADAWCAAFVWKKSKDSGLPYPITEDVFRRIEQNPYSVPIQIREEIQRLAKEYQFFHWHLAFPDIFSVSKKDEEPDEGQTGWRGGFNVILGNPPWEAEELIEKEFFADMAPEIASVRTKAKRVKLINSLAKENTALFDAWQKEKRIQIAQRQFYKESGFFPLGSQGKLNTYRLFAELAANLLKGSGRMAQVLKTGIVTAQDSQNLFQEWIRRNQVVAVYDFINTEKIFPDVVSNERFCLVMLSGFRNPIDVAIYAFGLTNIEQITDQTRLVNIRGLDLQQINPDDRSIPPVAGPRDYKLLQEIHRKFPILRLDKERWNPWQIRYSQGHLNSASGSAFFSENTLEQLLLSGGNLQNDQTIVLDGEIFLPLYEGKYINQMNHRFGTFEGVPVEKRFGIKAEAKDPSLSDLSKPDFEIQPSVVSDKWVALIFFLRYAV